MEELRSALIEVLGQRRGKKFYGQVLVNKPTRDEFESNLIKLLEQMKSPYGLIRVTVDTLAEIYQP